MEGFLGVSTDLEGWKARALVVCHSDDWIQLRFVRETRIRGFWNSESGLGEKFFLAIV